jgi:hypothetical protein
MLACGRNPKVAHKHYLESGRHYLQQRKYEEARIQFMNASKLDPRSARRGYLTMNSGRGSNARNAGKLSLEEYRNLLPAFEIKDERPLTQAYNYILVWGRKESNCR